MVDCKVKYGFGIDVPLKSLLELKNMVSALYSLSQSREFWIQNFMADTDLPYVAHALMRVDGCWKIHMLCSSYDWRTHEFSVVNSSTIVRDCISQVSLYWLVWCFDPPRLCLLFALRFWMNHKLVVEIPSFIVFIRTGYGVIHWCFFSYY